MHWLIRVGLHVFGCIVDLHTIASVYAVWECGSVHEFLLALTDTVGGRFSLCDLLMNSKLLSTSATPSTLYDDPHQFS